MSGLMGRGRTHAVATYSINGRDMEELEFDIQEEISEKMNLGLPKDRVYELYETIDELDGTQITSPEDVNVICREKDFGGRAECVVAVDDVPWF